MSSTSQVNRQYVKGAKSGIRRIAVMMKRDSPNGRSFLGFTLKGQLAEDPTTKVEAG
jgi:hypothetical protein